jgi:plasmid stabilization system protein ParE
VKQYAVLLTPTVENQILDEALFISNDSVQRAVAWDARVRTTLRRHLGDAPFAYALDERATTRLGREVHRYVFEKTFMVRYTIDDSSDTVTIFDFRHGARQPEP